MYDSGQARGKCGETGGLLCVVEDEWEGELPAAMMARCGVVWCGVVSSEHTLSSGSHRRSITGDFLTPLAGHRV